jgi:acyl dehydratase
MVGEVKQVGARTCRERFGRCYEDFQVGDGYEHRPGRTISQYDNISFTLLTTNTHSMHFDEEYAKHSEFGRCIGWTDIRLTHPLFAGDTLYAHSEVLEKRESQSRPNAGLATVKTTGVNQAGVAVCDAGSDFEAKANY